MLFHPGTMEVGIPDAAVEEYYGMGNPSVKLLMEGFSGEDIEATREYLKETCDALFEGGARRQVAILATTREAK